MSLTYNHFDITNSMHARQVKELQLASYPIEAKLIGMDELPPMRDTVESLQSCGEYFIGCFDAARLVGAISYKLVGTTIDIHRLMVHPDWFRKGIAQSLLNLALADQTATKAIVSTGTANTPAVLLYEKNGFQETHRKQIAPGVTLSYFERLLNQG